MCPYCRLALAGTEEVERKKYAVNVDKDRRIIVEASNRGEDWKTLAATLGVKYKTAYTWVRSGEVTSKPKGGTKPKKISNEESEQIIHWVEQNPSVTLKQLQSHVMSAFGKSISTTTVGNVLHAKVYTVKTTHQQPVTMNSEDNKHKRREYVRNLSSYIRQGRQVIWLDETNFNLFIRRKCGWSKAGQRAVVSLPTSRGPNIHLIGAVTSHGVVKMETRRGSFNWQRVNEWVQSLLEEWVSNGFRLEDLVVVADNAPSHSRLSLVFEQSAAVLLKLGPYSPMLNPIESIWSKIKSHVKSAVQIPQVEGPGLQEQRLVYLEGLVNEAKNSITAGDCARAAQHASSFFNSALDMEDMNVGM